MAAQLYTGRCLCGATRWSARGPASNLCCCHCRSCRGAGSAPFVGWATFARAGFSFAGAEPRGYRSSPPVVRRFCAMCGSPLTYEHERRPDELDVALATLDEPGALRPECHIWVSHKLPWVALGDGLPQHAEWRKGG